MSGTISINTSENTSGKNNVGSWIDVRFMSLLKENICAALVLNELIRCQFYFGGPFFHSSRQFQKALAKRFCKDTLTRAIRLILEVIPGVARWMGASGKCLRVSHYALDLEMIRGFLRENDLPDYLCKGDAGYPSGNNAAPAPLNKGSARGVATETVPVPVEAVPELEGLSTVLTSSYAWKTLLKHFPKQITFELAQFLQTKITERGLHQLEQFVFIIEQKLEQGQKISSILNYLRGCYKHSSQTQTVGHNSALSKLTSSMAQVTVKPNPEDLSLPPGLEMDALWELEGKQYTIWNISGRFITLEDSSGVRKAFPLEQVKKGQMFQPLIQ
jgi:hypothetical protein